MILAVRGREGSRGVGSYVDSLSVIGGYNIYVILVLFFTP